MAQMNDGTTAGLILFLEWAKEKGVIPANTAGAMISTCSKVFGIDSDIESHSVDEINLEQQFDRFTTLHGAEYSPGSLATYQARFKRSVEFYQEYRADPLHFSPPTRKKRTASTSRGTSDDSGTSNSAAESTTPQEFQSSDDLITYPFPLRSGPIAKLQLPVRLSTFDAERLSAFLKSIAFDKQLALTESDGVD